MLYSIWFYDLSSLSQCKKAEWYLWNAELTNQGFFLFIFISVVFLKNFLKEQSFCVSNIFKHILKQKTEHPLSKVKAVLEAARAVGNGKLKRCYWCCWGEKNISNLFFWHVNWAVDAQDSETGSLAVLRFERATFWLLACSLFSLSAQCFLLLKCFPRSR